MFETLDDSNFILFCAKYYENPNGDQIEFEEDLDRIKYIKRLFRKYSDGGELRERLILNHLIVLYNVFYHQSCTRMLSFRLYDHLEYLKPFLVYLNYWPERVEPVGLDKQEIIDSDISMDENIVKVLRGI
jgi:hypothetical protein|tara:strand:- start:263 stop:652 length:390 start_codon:yes stop_codon:yes gene_type:complete